MENASTENASTIRKGGKRKYGKRKQATPVNTNCGVRLNFTKL